MNGAFGLLIAGVRSAAVVSWIVLSLGALGARAAAEPRTEDSFTVLSYNVMGLPKNGSSVGRRFPTIGWLAQKYDLVLTQEVFGGARLLEQQLAGKKAMAGPGWRWWRPDFVIVKFLLAPGALANFWPPFGAGLYTFVDERFLPGNGRVDASRVAKAAYRRCYGYSSSSSDCFSHKGFVGVTISMPGGAQVDVYNTHLDAGSDDESREVRQRQLEELACAIEKISSGRPVIVAGDFNIAYARKRDRYAIDRFRNYLGLVDAGAGAQYPHWRERDYILHRDGTTHGLAVRASGEATEFVQDGYALSDHPALFADFGIGEPHAVRRDAALINCSKVPAQ